jgi:hypothetical protein
VGRVAESDENPNFELNICHSEQFLTEIHLPGGYDLSGGLRKLKLEYCVGLLEVQTEIPLSIRHGLACRVRLASK